MEFNKDLFEEAYEQYRCLRIHILRKTISFTLDLLQHEVFHLCHNKELLVQRQKLHFGIIDNMKNEFKALQ
jgi:hypothetical protein